MRNFGIWIRSTGILIPLTNVAFPDPNPDPSDPYFVGLMDPTDPLVRFMDPDPSIYWQK